MASQEPYIELRVPHPQTQYVALIGGIDPHFGLERLFDPFWERPDRYPGTQEMIHHLPDIYALYEIQEVIEGRKHTYYVATAQGDQTIYRINKDSVWDVVEHRLTIPQLVQSLREKHV